MTKTLKAELVGAVVGIVTMIRPVVAAIGRRDRGLETQIRRALNGVGLNVAEAFGAQRGNSRVRLET